MKNYVPLHAHDTYGSIGDSVLFIDKYVAKAKSLGIESLAITNHGSLSTFVNFYEECRKNDIKPIIGCEMYFCDDRNIKTKENNRADHLILLAKDYEGLQNLIRIHNDAHLNGFYFKPRTDPETLKKYSKGLICMTACIGSPLGHDIRNNSAEDLARHLFVLKSIFGNDLYLEIQPGKMKEQLEYNDILAALSEKLNILLVATNDIHYLNKEDCIMHNMHIRDFRKIYDSDKMIYPDDIYYFMDIQTLYDSFVRSSFITDKIVKEAIKNTNIVAGKCNLEIPKMNIMPEYSSDIDQNKYLRQLCEKGLDDLSLSSEDRKIYTDRLNYELDVISKLGFSGYFLIVKDFITYCDNNDIARGPGRGSGAGSIVSYLLNISIADPIKYDLMFERFLSIHRKSIPDIDLDISGEDKKKLHHYIRERYGYNHCCFVSTFNMRKARAAVKAACRLNKLPASTGDRISQKIPYVSYDADGEKMVDISINDAMDIIPEFRDLANSYKKTINLAISLEGLPSSVGIHPAGVVISPQDITSVYPLIKCNNEELLSTSLDLKDVEKLSGVKFDLLSLSSLSAIDRTLKEIGIKFNYRDERLLSDDKVWKLIGSDKTTGLFQISSKTYKSRMPLLKPKNIKELAACLALVRGPCISSGADKKYIEILQHKREPNKLHSIYWNVTKETNGIIIYQEQILKICINLGFDSEEAYKLMKAVSKKKMTEIAKYRSEFFRRGADKDVSEEILETIWQEIQSAGLYAFNVAHAVSYALLCYCSAYLKVYYPREYITNLLTREYMKNSNDLTVKENISYLLEDCQNLNIPIYPLDINKSQWNFSLYEDGIIMGFCALKSFGESSYLRLKEVKDISDIDEFLEKAPNRALNKRAISALIAAQAFRSITDMSSKDIYSLYMTKRKEKDYSYKISINKKESIDLSSYNIKRTEKILFNTAYNVLA